MRVFTVLGVAFTIIGAGLLIAAFMPTSGGIAGQAMGMGAGIAAITLLPMGIIFTLIGVGASRAAGGRRHLLETGIPGQATVLSVSGGNVVVNTINVLLTFRLRVMLPGRAPYEVDHRQLTSMFQMASLQIGATVPVMVDPVNPGSLVIDLVGEGRAAGATAARPVGGVPAGGGATATVMPNTLSSMGGVVPNTIDTYPPARGDLPAGATYPSAPGLDAASIAAVSDQLSRMGITIDPNMLAGAQLTMDSTTLDLRPGVQEQVLATGRPGSAVIRSLADTGVNVRGDSLVRLTLDVTPDGGTPYQAEAGGLIPDTARDRAVPGATLRVRIDPAQPTNVVIDWAASP